MSFRFPETERIRGPTPFLNYVLERGGVLGCSHSRIDRQKYYEALKGSQLDFRNFLCGH